MFSDITYNVNSVKMPGTVLLRKLTQNYTGIDKEENLGGFFSQNFPKQIFPEDYLKNF